MQFEHRPPFSPQGFSPGTDINTEPPHPDFFSGTFHQSKILRLQEIKMKKLPVKSSAKIKVAFLCFAAVLVTVPSMFCGCAHTEKVLLPPRVELKAYQHIGVIEFSTNAEDTLKAYVTQNFIQNIQSAQPGTRILELGDEQQLLRSLGQNQLDPQTIQSIGKKYNVDALILGHLEVSDIKPKISLYTAPKELQAGAYIQAALRTKILETNSGATLWTNATTGKTRIANISVIEEGSFRIGVSDPKEKYGKLVPELVYVNTHDFRCQYEYRKVK
jgi:hypothetical protein